MRPADNIKRLIKNAKITINPDVKNVALKELINELEMREANGSAIPEPNIWRIIMKSKITKLAAAAVIIIAVLVGIHHFGGSIDGTSVAWGDVVKKVEQIPNFICRMRQIENSGVKSNGFEFVTESEIINYNSSQYGTKTESYRNGELITRSFILRQGKIFVGICPPAKEYEQHSLSQSELEEMDQMNPREIVKRFMSSNHKTLGHTTINGIEAEGIKVYAPEVLKANPPALDSFVARLWVDMKTELPVWLELEFVPKGLTTTTKIVADKFMWDVKFSATDFTPDIPVDYTLEKKRISNAIRPEQPKIELQESERYLSKFENVTLPNIKGLRLLDVEDNEPKQDIALVGHIEIWKTQDNFIRNWPLYSQVHDQLYKELSEKLNIDSLSEEETVATGLALREEFWKKGGCLSKISYPFGYGSRILMEIAHNKSPADLDITDELVESILSVELGWHYIEDSEGKIENPCYQEVLKELRLSQFQQIETEIEQGRVPNWKDFVRVNDLAILLGRAKDYKAALEVIDWLTREADKGGWTAYLNIIERMRKHYSNGEKFYYNIYVNKRTDVFPEEYRYARRLPSFQGPFREKRGVIPAHINNPNPVWTGD